MLYLVRVNFKGYATRKKILHRIEDQQRTNFKSTQVTSQSTGANLQTSNGTKRILKIVSVVWKRVFTNYHILNVAATSTLQNFLSSVPLFCCLNLWPPYSLSVFVDLCIMGTCWTVVLELNWTSQTSVLFDWQGESVVTIIYSRFISNESLPSTLSSASEFLLSWGNDNSSMFLTLCQSFLV